MPLPLLLLLLVFLGTLTGCEDPTHINSDVAHRYRTSIDLGPIERGWDLTWVGRLIDRPTVIAHKIEVQADLAGDLVRMSNGELRDLVGERACPSASHQIWKQIKPAQDVEVELSTKKNGPFATVSCRSAVL